MSETINEPVKKKRGRPRKVVVEECQQLDISSMMGSEESEPAPKKKRGRPRKNPLPETAEVVTEEVSAPAPKKRGRSKKNPLPETSQTVDDAVTESVEEVNTEEVDADLLLTEPLTFAVVGKLSAKDVSKFTDGKLEINATISSLRTLCSMYKMQQRNRIAASNQVSAFERGETVTIPESVISVLRLSVNNMLTIEQNYAKVIEAVAQKLPICQWLASISGIGLKTAAMLVTEIDMSRVNQPSSIAQYMGMNSQNSPIYSVDQIKQICKEAGIVQGKPISKESLVKVAIMTGRNRKTLINVDTYEGVIKAIRKIPYNKDCKTLLYLVSDQFVKQSGASCKKNPDGSIKSLYGRIYREYKAQFSLINESGGYAKQAADELATKNISSKEFRQTLESGKLSAAHIDMRARRKALAVFVYHFAVAMWLQFKPGEKITRPYVIQYGGHKDYIEPEVPFQEYFNIPEGGIYIDAPATERVYDASKYVRRFRKDDVTYTKPEIHDLDEIVTKIMN